MTVEERRRERFDFGRVFTRAFATFRTAAIPALLITLVMIVAPLIPFYWAAGSMQTVDDLQRIFQPPTLYWAIGLGLLAMVFGFTGQTALVHLALSTQQGRTPSLSDSVGTGFRLFFPMWGLGILVGLGTALGYLLLIVPGIILTIMWCVSVPARIHDGPGVTAAMEESSNLTKGVRWPVFGMLIVTGILLYVISLIASVPAAFAPGPSAKVVLAVLTPLTAGLSTLITTFGPASLFHELKWGDRDPNEEATAELFA